MKKILFAFAVLAVTASCTEKNGSPENFRDSSADSSPNSQLHVQMDFFEETDSSSVLMFPLQMGQTKNRSGEYDYKEMPESTYWNMVFLNTETHAQHLLSEQKMMILSYDLHDGDENSTTPETPQSRYIFYRVISSDRNKDRLLNEADPVYLYVSDRSGKNFRQISPKDYSVFNWKYFPSSDRVILTAYSDQNKDGKFDTKDESSTFETFLSGNAQPEEVFTGDFKAKMKKLYDRDWKKIE